MKKLLSLVAIFLLSASPAFAMTTPVFVMSPLTNVSNTLARDFFLGGNGGAGGSNGVGNQTPMPIAGTFSNLTFSLFSALTSGSYSLTLVKNGTLTANTCTISSGQQSCTDTTHPISVVAGDLMSLEMTPTSTPLPLQAGGTFASIQFDGTTAGESFISSAFRLPSTAVTQYGPLGYIDPSTETVETAASIVFPTSGTIDLLRVTTANPPGATKGWAFSLRQGTTISNEATTSLTCTISGSGTPAHCEDLTDTVTVSAGDILSMVALGVTTPLAGQSATVAVRFKPTVDGESVMLSSWRANLSTGPVSFTFPAGYGSNIQSEATTSANVSTGFTWEKLYTAFDTAPGGTASRTHAARLNKSSQTLTCAVTGAATTCNDTTHTVAITAGGTNLIDFSSTPANTPAASLNIRISAVAFIAPPATGAAVHSSGFFTGNGYFKSLFGYFL